MMEITHFTHFHLWVQYRVSFEIIILCILASIMVGNVSLDKSSLCMSENCE